MPYTKRCSYQDLKNQALDAYYDFCRDEVKKENSSQIKALARLNYHFEGTLDHPLEELMFCVIELILSGGWHEDVEKNCREWIENWKLENDFSTLIEKIPAEEMEIFMHDAKIIKLF